MNVKVASLELPNFSPAENSKVSEQEEFVVADVLDSGVIELSSSDDEGDADVPEMQKINGNRNNPGNIPRNHSYSSFLTRSERHRLEGKDPPLSSDEAARRKVKFPENDDELEAVHEVEPIADEEKKNYWLDGTDFDRFDNDVKITVFRWKNHMSGELKFDDENNSIRGLEGTITGSSRDDARNKWKHRQAVLKEISSARLNGKTLDTIDWEKVREISIQNSLQHLKKAVELGVKDEQARISAWNKKEHSASRTNPHEVVNKKNKKKGFNLRFWKN